MVWNDKALLATDECGQNGVVEDFLSADYSRQAHFSAHPLTLTRNQLTHYQIPS
jgi:hypothetical protein